MVCYYDTESHLDCKYVLIDATTEVDLHLETMGIIQSSVSYTQTIQFNSVHSMI